MCRLSIIIPVYNVKKYVSKCIHSIISSKFTDYEVIIIDDGSTDGSLEYVKQLIKHDERFSVYHQENQGVSVARNYGLSKAVGKYISFVDPDDWISPQYYSSMISLMDNEGYDIACCNWYEYDDLTKSTILHIIPKGFIINNNEDIIKSTKIIGASVWNKIFRRKVIKHRFKEEIIIGEDWLFLVYNCLHSCAVFFTEQPYYYYRIRSDSAMNVDPVRKIKTIEVNKEILSIVGQNKLKCFDELQRDYLDRCLWYKNWLESLGEFNKTGEIQKEMKQYIQDHFWELLCNRKIKRKQLFFIFFSLKRKVNE